MVFYGVSAVWTLGAYLLASAGIIWMEPSADAFWVRLTGWEIVFLVGEGVLTIGAVGALFYLKTLAFRLFLIIWIVDSFEYFRLVWFSPSFLKELDLSNASILLMSYGLITFVVYYAHRLKRSNILTE